MGNQMNTGSRRQIVVSTVETNLGVSMNRLALTIGRDSSGNVLNNDVPKPFTTFRSLSFEWNLCGEYDPTRRVNVVSDMKLQRKGKKYLFVDKCVRMKHMSESIGIARNELEIMCYLSNYAQQFLGFIHPNIVHLTGYFSFQQKLHVIVEFCELGNLMTSYIQAPEDGLRLHAMPSEGEVASIMRQICSGLEFLHANGIAHCDLSLENIFVTQENVPKIGDFESAVFVGPESVPQQLRQAAPSRMVYGAPELYQQTNASHSHGYGAFRHIHDPNGRVDLLKADVWAIGIIFVMLLTKKPLFDAATIEDKGFQLFRRVGLRSYMKAMYLEQSSFIKFSDDLLDLAEGLLTVDPHKRLSMWQALQMKWLGGDLDAAGAALITSRTVTG